MKLKITSLNKNVVYLGLVSFLTDVSSDMIYPILPLFLTEILGVTFVFIGLIEGIAEGTSSILKVVSGFWSDRVGKRKGLIIFGYSLSALGKPLLSVASAGWHVLLIRFLDRFGKGVRTSPRDALIADSAPDRKGIYFGLIWSNGWSSSGFPAFTSFEKQLPHSVFISRNSRDSICFRFNFFS